MRNIFVAYILLFPIILMGQSLDRIEQVLHHSFSDVSSVDVDRAQARLDLINKKNGLRFQSAVTNNDYAGLELGNVWRMSTGISFDLLQNGIREKKHEKAILQVEKELAELQLHKNTLDKNYGYLFNYFIYTFNQEKKLLLQQKQLVLNSLINKNYDLYYNHELSFDEILYLQSLSEEAKIMISAINHADKLFESIINVEEVPTFSPRSIPLFELDIDSIMARNPHANLEQEALLKQKRAKHVESLNDQQKLSLYANVHYRPDIGDQERVGFYNNFGVRYSTPLRFDNKQQAKLVAIEQERIVAQNDDIIFNEQKELINYILDYDTKLRQYSNFHFKLRKLQENKRVQSAIMNVSTHQVTNRRDWKIDLEILNVQYELLELKQLLYLSMLRIYNKANLTSLKPYVTIKSLEFNKSRFKGKRVLKVADHQKDKIMNEFVIDYLQKNNFEYALWLGAEVPADLQSELYKHGITLVGDVSMYSQESIIQVPVKQFSNRGNMELWIEQMLLEHQNSYLFFEAIDELLLLDSKTLGE